MRAAFLWLAVGLGGCAGAPVVTLPEAARQSPDRFVVVTLKSRATGGTAGATSTARGYDSLVTYAGSSASRTQANSIATAYGLGVTAGWPIEMLGVRCVVYALPAGSSQSEVLSRLARDPRVESAMPLATFVTQSAAYNDPYAGLQHGLEQMAVPQAQEWSRGDGVRVAIIDTGVDLAHPDLRGRIAEHRNFVDGDEAAFSSDVHGTAVAGVIGAVANNHIGIAGIAPGAALLAFKACWKPASQGTAAVCNTFTLAQALVAAIDAHAAIVNLSLAGPSDPLLRRIVEHGLHQGVIFVAAAPPAGAHAGFPGDIDGVITVDAPDHRAGVSTALTAPGNDVLTLAPRGHYDFASGSSLAAAQVSGIIALLLAREHHLTGAEARRILDQTSKTVTSDAGPVVSVDACAALVALQHRGLCPLPAGTETLQQTSSRN